MNDTTTRFPAPAEPEGASAAIQCAGCPNAFLPRRRWQTFCSDRCRSAHHSRQTRLEAIREASPRMFEALHRLANGATGEQSAQDLARAAIGDLKAP